MVVVPLVMLILLKGQWCFGWASTPIDAAWAHRHPRRAALMSAAGPMANLVLAAIASVQTQVPVLIDSGPNVPLGHVIDVYDVARLQGFGEVQFAATGL